VEQHLLEGAPLISVSDRFGPMSRWHDLQELLRERDVLWQAASPETRAALAATRSEYGRIA
jgi:hypothetical protein